MKKVIATALVYFFVFAVGATAANAQAVSKLLTVNDLPTDLYTSTYLTLEQPNRTPIEERLNYFWAYENLYLDEPIRASLDSEWSSLWVMSKDETLVGCFLEFGLGLQSTRWDETSPKKVLGTIPVNFEWQERDPGFGSPLYYWRLTGGGTIPGPSGADRGDLKTLTFRLFCGERLVYTNQWTLKGIVGKPSAKTAPTLSITGDSATVGFGSWSGLGNLDLISYSWFTCEGSGASSNCQQVGDDVVKYSYELTRPVTFNLNSGLKNKYLAVLVSVANSYGATSEWTEFAFYEGETPTEPSKPEWTVNQKTLATFGNSATTLTSQQKAQVRATVEANPNAEKFICTGIRYYSQPMSVNIMVRKRAKAACEYAKQLNPNLSTWYQNKPTQARSYAGKVLLTVKSPNY